MSTTLEPIDIDTLKADVARLKQRLDDLSAEQASPALRTDAKRKAEIGYELQNLAVLIADARVAVIEADIAKLDAQRHPLYEERTKAHADSQNALLVGLPKAQQALRDAEQHLRDCQWAYQHAENNLNSLSQQISQKQAQIAAIRAGKG